VCEVLCYHAAAQIGHALDGLLQRHVEIKGVAAVVHANANERVLPLVVLNAQREVAAGVGHLLHRRRAVLAHGRDGKHLAVLPHQLDGHR